MSGSTKSAMRTVASRAKPSRIPQSSRTNSTAGGSMIDPLPAELLLPFPVKLVKSRS